jgi:hypothetical protein
MLTKRRAIRVGKVYSTVAINAIIGIATISFIQAQTNNITVARCRSNLWTIKAGQSITGPTFFCLSRMQVSGPALSIKD